MNELLGLEQLDALRAGLNDSTDFRLLKKLSRLLDEATEAAGHADDDLSTQAGLLQKTRGDLAQARIDLLRALGALDQQLPTDGDAALVELAETTLRGSRLNDERATATQIDQELVALGGRVAAITERQSTARLDAAQKQLEAARVTLESWRVRDEPAVLAVQQEVADLRPMAARPQSSRTSCRPQNEQSTDSSTSKSKSARLRAETRPTQRVLHSSQLSWLPSKSGQGRWSKVSQPSERKCSTTISVPSATATSLRSRPRT